jgi:hypothetical protein
MNPQKQFVSVSLEVLREYDLSFFEAGILERVRYFAEYDESGSGWCYVGKERLAKEFNISKQGVIKAISRLVARNLLIKNDKGWLNVNFEAVNKVDSKQSLPVNKVARKSKQSLPNIILNKDIHTNDSISSIDSNSVGSTKLTGKESLPVKKVDSKPWLKMNREQYHEYQLGLGKEPVGEFGVVYLTPEQIEKIQRENSKVVYTRVVEVIQAYKEKEGYNVYGNDYASIVSWALDRAKKDLSERGVDVNAILFKEREARKQAQAEAKEQEIIEKRKTNPELFQNE